MYFFYLLSLFPISIYAATLPQLPKLRSADDHNLPKRAGAGIDCFHAPPPPNILYAPDGVDCINAATQLIKGDKADAPMQFSRDTELGFSVPHSWKNGTCVILIDLDNPRSETTFPLSAIGMAALGIMIHCVDNAVHALGGRSFAGPQNSMKVLLLGCPKDPVDPPPRQWPGFGLGYRPLKPSWN